MKNTETVSNPQTSIQTPQELERAIQQYRTENWQGQELFYQWQAIRAAALAQAIHEKAADQVPGEDSY